MPTDFDGLFVDLFLTELGGGVGEDSDFDEAVAAAVSFDVIEGFDATPFLDGNEGVMVEVFGLVTDLSGGDVEGITDCFVSRLLEFLAEGSDGVPCLDGTLESVGLLTGTGFIGKSLLLGGGSLLLVGTFTADDFNTFLGGTVLLSLLTVLEVLSLSTDALVADDFGDFAVAIIALFT